MSPNTEQQFVHGWLINHEALHILAYFSQSNICNFLLRLVGTCSDPVMTPKYVMLSKHISKPLDIICHWILPLFDVMYSEMWFEGLANGQGWIYNLISNASFLTSKCWMLSKHITIKTTVRSHEFIHLLG